MLAVAGRDAFDAVVRLDEERARSLDVDGLAELYLDETLLIDEWSDQDAVHRVTTDLEAGRSYRLVIRYGKSEGDGSIVLRWRPPGGSTTTIPSQALRAEDTEDEDFAYVAAWEWEGADDDWTLHRTYPFRRGYRGDARGHARGPRRGDRPVRPGYS